MNAPLSNSLQSAMKTVTLDDKYSLDHGRAFMSGVQALVRLPMLQRERDALIGKNTAGFISGYRGSPLGNYDQALWKAKPFLQANNIVFQPGVNEELAATALWGTQQLGFAPAGANKFDGVFGIWYGKGPGVDRCADVFKHANMAGTTPWGGVIAVAGDDHIAKSSTAAHQSDHIFKACGTPVFFPNSVQSILDLGLHAFAMSRFSGVWAGMKTIQEIVESSATAVIDPARVNIVTPEFTMPPGGVHIRWPDDPLSQETRLMDYKWYAALAYIRANRLNHNVIEGAHDRLGLIASGKAYNDTRQALIDLGLDDATCRQLGIRLHCVAVVWPLEAQTTREFAAGLQEILVIEEKRQVIEYQLKEELYNWRSDVRPNVFGKFNEVDGDFSGGEWSMPNPSTNTLLRANADLNPAIIARAIAQRVKKLGVDGDMAARIDAQLGILADKERAMQTLTIHANHNASRSPWFCSGCPHNTSTRVPEGSRAMAGIGCHYMVLWMDRSTCGFTQMGGEGVPWVGQQPFSHTSHMFANLGDGTYFHSGLLAIRQAIASGVNITYKILYNDAVAMTGGQPIGERPEGHSVQQIAQSLRAEGAAKIAVVTDEPQKYDGIHLPTDIAIHHRDAMDDIQKQMREITGTTAIIYDQTCATEKRRRRKRGLLVDPAKRVFINELVCEGCGDCSVQSNCISVEPLETEFGRKRTINQSTCNKDFSCINGFCPSFVTVEGGTFKKKRTAPQVGSTLGESSFTPSEFEFSAPPPEPKIPLLGSGQVWATIVAGVGGTGVITIGQILGMAAHLEGKGIVTQDAAGLAQKGGATWSHVLIATSQSEIRTTRVSMAAADLVMGCDPLVTASKDTLRCMRHGRTHVALNSHGAPTAAFVKNANWKNPVEDCLADITSAVGESQIGCINADLLAVQLMGDSLYANPMLLGFAWQKGWLPLSLASLLRAFELNAQAVSQNQAAFLWGRRAAHDMQHVMQCLSATAQTAQIMEQIRHETLDDVIDHRAAFLTDYQNAEYADRYLNVVNEVRQADSRLPNQSQALTMAVAKNLFRLMAYKDEYEVARLHNLPSFLDRIRNQFEGDFQLRYYLAPPLFAKKNAQGEPQKKAYGASARWAFKCLAKLKGLRGTAWDIFGHSDERRMERTLIADYSDLMALLCQNLTARNYELATQLATVAEQIKGYGSVKARNVANARRQWAHLLSLWPGSTTASTESAPVTFLFESQTPN